MLEINNIKEISIVDFCNNNGIPLNKQHGRYLCLKEHDSLVINTDKNRFIWNSRQLSGDIIDFVKAIYNVDFTGAIGILEGDTSIKHKETSRNEEDIKPMFNIKDVHQVKIFKHAFAYLTRTRQLSVDTINYFYQRGVIRQDIHNNLIIYILDKQNRRVGAFLKGTNPNYPYECILPGTPNIGIVINFCKSPKKIYFFEALIDLMSYFELFPENSNDAAFISLNGLKINCLLDNLSNYRDISEIILAVDNDQGGDKFVKGVLNNIKGYKITRDLPICKDWNDDIKLKKTTRE
jgi:DNA primase